MIRHRLFGAGIVIMGIVLAGLQGLPAYAQSTQQFIIKQFSADYYLSKDAEGRSRLKTVEKITAVFPAVDQNHGLERALPKSYDNHGTSLKVQSVTNAAGASIEYGIKEDDNDNLVLRIGNAATYVHGEQTYVITYTQRDVTKFFKDTNDDEFYWDVNGTQWQQPMQEVSARVHVPSALAKQLTNKNSCYWGKEGATSLCVVQKTKDDGDTVLSAVRTNLGPGENVTLALGFMPHSFTPYQPTAAEKIGAALAAIWGFVQLLSVVAVVVGLVWMIRIYIKAMGRHETKKTIIPEYLPPRDTSVLMSAIMLKNARSDMTAQIIDLAVRHYLKIYQTKEKSLFKQAEYELEIIKPLGDLQTEERGLIIDLFGSGAQPGSRFAMKKLQNNTSIHQRLLKSRKTNKQLSRTDYELFERAKTEAQKLKRVGIVTIIVGVITLSPLIIIMSIVAFILMYTAWPPTSKGVVLRNYLKGLQLYIKVAETERIKLLQSPEGAEKVGTTINANDPKQLIKLYERVLPYAILLGIEKEWMKSLGGYYETAATQPDWYTGQTAFNAVVFSSALGNFSAQSSSYSSSASSSSGGSSGGGSSGGGGGGGGGGGW